MPGTAVRVVKEYAPVLDFALVNEFNNVDLPTLGNPIRTTVASPAFLTSKPALPPPVETVFPCVFSSSSLFNFAIFALRRPM